tara:strand:- start:120 stop:359 length:240 start_codon:yes stop_codon:yes gene_type:complete
MPKYVIREGILDKLIQTVFKLAATGEERKAINTVLGKDPQFKKDMKDLATLRKKIEKNFKKQMKDHPDILKIHQQRFGK